MGGAWQVVACSLAGFRATPFLRCTIVIYCVKVVQHHNAIVAETTQIYYTGMQCHIVCAF